jgi:hypothetical protein
MILRINGNRTDHPVETANRRESVAEWQIDFKYNISRIAGLAYRFVDLVIAPAEIWLNASRAHALIFLVAWRRRVSFTFAIAVQRMCRTGSHGRPLSLKILPHCGKLSCAAPVV